MILLKVTTAKNVLFGNFVFNHWFSFQDYLCDGCHNLTMLSVNIIDIAIITVKNVGYRCIVNNISKSEAISLLKNSVVEDSGYLWKNIVLYLSLFKTISLTFLFSIYKMIDSMDIYRSLNINIGTVKKNLEIIKFVPDHLKTKKMCKHAVKKLPYLLRYVPDQCKTQQICDKAILENAGTLEYVPDCYKNKKMCNNAVENYPHALEFVPECYKTHKMCD